MHIIGLWEEAGEPGETAQTKFRQNYQQIAWSILPSMKTIPGKNRNFLWAFWLSPCEKRNYLSWINMIVLNDRCDVIQNLKDKY